MKLITLFDEENYNQRSGIVRKVVVAIIIKDAKLLL